MSRNQISNILTIALVAAIVFVADQRSKALIVAHFPEPTLVINHLLRWNVTQNFHGAFGFFGSSKPLLIAMALVVLLIFWFSFRDITQRSRLVRVAFGMIVGGAIGNIYDRVHLGYVIDFVDFYRIWPNIFNIADSCITIGVALLLLKSLATHRRA